MSKYVYILIIFFLSGCTPTTLKHEPSVTNTISYPTITKTLIHPTPPNTTPKPTATWESIIRFVPTLTSMPEIDYESIIQEGKNFPDVVSIEKRNGEYRAVDERGLSRYALREWTWVEIPQIKPSDITEDDRLYYDKITYIESALFPYGIKKIRTGLYPEYPEVENWAISGILLKEPYIRNGYNQLVFKVGIPVVNDFIVINIIDSYRLKSPDLKETSYLFFDRS
jgi:hypothetical protein